MSSARTYLDFERPLAELDSKIDDLKALNGSDAKSGGGVDVTEEVARLEAKAEKQLKAIYAKLGAWEKTQVARHPSRPHFHDYLDGMITDFTPLSGDRKFGDDQAMIGGLGRLRGRPIVILGQEKAMIRNPALNIISVWPGLKATAKLYA